MVSATTMVHLSSFVFFTVPASFILNSTPYDAYIQVHFRYKYLIGRGKKCEIPCGRFCTLGTHLVMKGKVEDLFHCVLSIPLPLCLRCFFITHPPCHSLCRNKLMDWAEKFETAQRSNVIGCA